MPQLQGEVSLLTLFADVHYYFSHPAAKPPHHRFDKTSYVYLFQDPIQRRGRLEVANHAGTPDQDAFQGYLDTVQIEQSFKHPTLFTITIDAGQQGSPAATPANDLSQWHLPTHDLRNENKYMYKLHTIDVYFWTANDAQLFLDSLKRVLQSHQLRILDAPAPLPDARGHTVSPVVQKLEQAAISTHHGRSGSVATTASIQQPTPTNPSLSAAPVQQQQSLPPPPPLPQQQQAQEQTSFAPMAYNPAAPAAPEPISHREKTPPPAGAEDGTGLTAAAQHDHANTPFNQIGSQPGAFPQSTSNQPYMPGPPSRTNTGSIPQQHPGRPAGTPPVGVQRTNTTGSIPSTSATPGQPYMPSFAGPPQVATPQPYGSDPTSGYPQQQQQQQQQQHPGFGQSPGVPAQSPGQPSPGYQPQQQAGSPPPGGYTQYSYGSTQPTEQYGVQNQMHQQVYRPSQPESTAHAQNTKPTSSFAARTERLEKGVGKFLKKLDKKL